MDSCHIHVFDLVVFVIVEGVIAKIDLSESDRQCRKGFVDDANLSGPDDTWSG